jgi:hypothetical protein
VIVAVGDPGDPLNGQAAVQGVTGSVG